MLCDHGKGNELELLGSWVAYVGVDFPRVCLGSSG